MMHTAGSMETSKGKSASEDAEDDQIDGPPLQLPVGFGHCQRATAGRDSPREGSRSRSRSPA